MIPYNKITPFPWWEGIEGRGKEVPIFNMPVSPSPWPIKGEGNIN